MTWPWILAAGITLALAGLGFWEAFREWRKKDTSKWRLSKDLIFAVGNLVVAVLSVITGLDDSAKAADWARQVESLRQASEESREKTGRLQGQVSDATDTIKQLLAANDQLNAKIATRADVLTREVRQRLTEELRVSVPPKSVIFAGSEQSEEARQFSRALQNAFHKAGIVNREAVLTGPGYLTPGGVHIVYSGDKPGPVPLAIARAMLRAGVPGLHLLSSKSAPIAEGVLAHVWVFEKEP